MRRHQGGGTPFSDGQVQTLTLALALGREQEGLEADVQHWLAGLEERQAEVAAARETAWGEERQRLQEAVARLRRELHALPAPGTAGGGQ